MRRASGQASAKAHPNIALVKYWGKSNDGLNLPATGSLSITLDALHTRTSIRFDPALAEDEIWLDGAQAPDQTQRIGAFLDLMRARARTDTHARLESTNDFPTGAGLASSASGFAALAIAADRALGLGLAPPELSVLARRGSGSAARSIFGGFVEMAAGTREDGEDAFATPLLEPGAWPLEVVIAMTTREKKAVGSSAGMAHTRETSPFYRDWIRATIADLADARAAVLARDFGKLAWVSEASCLAMHAVMLSARPSLVYWNPATLECIQRIRALRGGGTGVFFTIDAGPQVKAICLPGDASTVADALRDATGVEKVLIGGLGAGACASGGTD
jgi:diphosphomevalonate decarboxylase